MHKKALAAAMLLTLLSLSVSTPSYHSSQLRINPAGSLMDPDRKALDLETLIELEEEPENFLDVLLKRRMRRNSGGLDIPFKKGQYCGKKLGRIIEIVCTWYSTEKATGGVAVKRSDGTTERDRSPLESGTMFPFRSKKDSVVFYPRGTFGIINECCLKSCTIQEVVSYCPED